MAPTGAVKVDSRQIDWRKRYRSTGDVTVEGSDGDSSDGQEGS